MTDTEEADRIPPRKRTRAGTFTAARRQRFFDTLALTCNVRQSAKAAGVEMGTVYYHRTCDPVFAVQWREALAAGYDRLEAMLLEYGGAGVVLLPADPDRAATGTATGAATGTASDGPAAGGFDFDRALKILQQYRSQRDGTPRRGRSVEPRATREETNAAILRALKPAERRVARREGGA